MRKELEYAKEVAFIAKLYRSELLSEKEYEKIMCSLVGNEAGEMCSPADTDTDGNRNPVCRYLSGDSTAYLGTGQEICRCNEKIQQMACRSVSEKERCQSMNIKSLKSKILLVGIVFMLVGTTVGLIGFGMTGFEPDRLMKWKEGRWYQTVNYTNGNFWIGIRLKGGRYITSFTTFD